MAKILVVMGVCGSGKTSVAERLAAVMGWHYHEADWSHPESNKAKMRQGIPLSDEDRYPWLLQLHQVMTKWADAGQNGVLTCSALKRQYRDILISGQDAQMTGCSADANSSPGSDRSKTQPFVEAESEESSSMTNDIDAAQHTVNKAAHCRSNFPVMILQSTVTFVYLRGDRDTLAGRMSGRGGHFMPTSLLDSQLETLEEPGLDENHITVDIHESLGDNITAILQKCSLSPVCS